MGRSRTVQVGGTVLFKDRGKPGTTEKSVTEFADSSPGPVASMMWTQNLVRYDAEGELRVNPAGVRAETESIKKTVVSTREYDKETFTRYAVESTGLTPKRALNATNREMAARAKATLAAAEAGKVKLSAFDKRILNPVADGRFVETVYGKRNQHEYGTMRTLLDSLKRPGVNSRDPAQRARARELADNLREYRYGDTSRYRSA